MSAPRVVVVGAGAAGTAAAVGLRGLGYDGDLTLVHAEAAPPYNRTAVNKALLQPGAELGPVLTAVPGDGRTTVLAATRAVELRADRRELVLDDGRVLGYDAVLVATGARPRTIAPLTAPDEPAVHPALPRVTTLRTQADAAHVRASLDRVRLESARPARVLVVGGSILGAETADTLHGLGHDVHLVDRDAAPLARLLGPAVAGWVGERQRESLAGVHEGTVERLDHDGPGPVARLSSGAELPVDLVVVALGVEPDTGWLAGSPADLGDGVLVDDRLRVVGTDGVLAAGDLARIGTAPRVEHWGHALAHGAHAARSIAWSLGLAEDPGPFSGSASWATRLHSRPVTVLGAPPHGLREVPLRVDPDLGLHVHAFATADGLVAGAAVLGSPKLANALRPLVARGADLSEATEAAAAVTVRAPARA